MLSSFSLLCSQYPSDDSYIQEQFSNVKNNPVLLSLLNGFKPSNIIDYISADKNGAICSNLKDFTIEQLVEAEELTNYWMFPVTWTNAIREEIAYKQKDYDGEILTPIIKSGMERMVVWAPKAKV